LTDYAAAFFLLGDSLKDCLGVCLRQLDDWQLAVMLARVYDGDDGFHLQALLHDHILPMAFAKGFRRLASWAFWMMKRRDLAVRVIVVSLLILRLCLASADDRCRLHSPNYYQASATRTSRRSAHPVKKILVLSSCMANCEIGPCRQLEAPGQSFLFEKPR
jgi:hypothetical protein